MKQHKKVIAGIVLGAGAAVLAGFAITGWQVGWGPFAKLHDGKMAGLPGNAARYAPENVEKDADSALTGKHLIFLGSSVTYGSAAKGVSFADYIAVRNGCTITKEAVSGTTLVDSGIGFYISRLKKLDTGMTADLFLCQLSTNDASQGKPLGKISESFDCEAFDTSTVAGAIEYIIAYARQTWSCPVLFYTNPRYSSEQYAAMVDLIAEIADKWDIGVIDLWSDSAFNSITEEQRALYMVDSIHPSQAGYLEWWTPYMEEILIKAVQEI